MRAGALLLSCATLILAGCATPMTMRDINAVKPNCAKIDRQIATLQKEKAENDQRLLAGIQSVAPDLPLSTSSPGPMGGMSPSPPVHGRPLSTASSSS
jgi:hypothetical protein